jgi:DNA-binding cell septation regulator SpoVG
MKKEIIYNGKTIIEGTNGYFTAFPSNHSAHTAKDFKTLSGAKKYLDGFRK